MPSDLPPIGIPLSVPSIGQAEVEAVLATLRAGWVSTVGAEVRRFEEEMAAYLGAAHGVATASGTAALHVALLVAGVRPGDEVLTSALTFIAPANAVRYCGAWPVFMDAEPAHMQMDVGQVERFLTRECRRDGGRLRNVRSGRPVTAILPVHLLGHPVEMEPLLELARAHGLKVICDATQSLGASYLGNPVPTLGDASVLSFNGNKLMTTGGGGMIVTDQPDWARRAKHLTEQANTDHGEYVHDEIGFNYRLTALSAALGRAQLTRLRDFVDSKRATAARYAEGIKDVPGLVLPGQASWAQSAWWLYTVRVNPAGFGMAARALRAALRAHGIETRTLWQPLHLSPALADDPWRRACPVAEACHAEALSLPSSVGITEEEQARVIAAIRASAAGS
jgi:perosamine synthetase